MLHIHKHICAHILFFRKIKDKDRGRIEHSEQRVCKNQRVSYLLAGQWKSLKIHQKMGKLGRIELSFFPHHCAVKLQASLEANIS